MDSLFNVGIDVGSTTIKLVVLDKAKQIVYKNYERHFSEIGHALHENLASLKKIVGEQKFSFALTGSAGMGIAQRIGLPFVQEVIACAAAVKELIPQTDTVVELGGEDAKITYFGDAPEQRMNGVCAGGTGSFIDHMASLLSTDAKGLNDLAAKGKQIYTIASRCGVFAKTDIQALMNDGAAKADIALSIFQAVVNQTIGNLAQGRPIGGHVAFLGGPLHFLPELKKRFIETLGLDAEHTVDVDYGNYFVAMGAALSDETARRARRISHSLRTRRTTRHSRRATTATRCRAAISPPTRGLSMSASMPARRRRSSPLSAGIRSSSTRLTAATTARRSRASSRNCRTSTKHCRRRHTSPAA